MDGDELLCRWREAGEWWLNEPYREHIRLLDSQSIVREHTVDLNDAKKKLASGQIPLVKDESEEWCLRERKIRNEKYSSPPAPTSEKEEKQRRETAETAFSILMDGGSRRLSAANGYVPLHAISGYAFGRSVMLTEEIATYASIAGCSGVAIVDPYSLIGASELDRACRRYGIKPLIGASIELPEGGFLVLIAQSKRGYRNLSKLITACHLDQPRNFPLGSWALLEEHAEDLLCLTGGDVGPLDRRLAARNYDEARAILIRLKQIFGKRVFLEIERAYLPWGLSVEKQLLNLAEDCQVTAVAGGCITHGKKEHFPAQDMVACIESLCLIEEVVGRKPLRDPSQPQIPQPPLRSLNSERYFRTQREMEELYHDQPHLLANTKKILDLCEDSVLPPRTNVPQLFEDDSHALREITESCALAAYRKITPVHQRRLNLEVERITRLGYASHFLIAWDVCRWSREQNIQMSGRGSVVDSAVAFVLGLSRIDAIEHKLHFDRFLPADNTKRPDIDIDFEAHRRDDIRGYMVGKYGVNRTAAVCAVGAFCTRGIIREVGKVMGLPEPTISFLAKKVHGGISPNQIEAALKERPELRDSSIPKEKFRWVIDLAERLMDVPRNIRTHSSGVVISDRPIGETVPLMWSATPSSSESGTSESMLRMIQWDKRSAKHFFDKFDILCLRGQDVLGGMERRIQVGNADFSVENIAATTDPEVYRAMRSGELIGIPQSASPAMRQAHVRLRTADLHDASLVQAGIRPGVGGAVKLNELIARRRGKPYTYEHPDFEAILGNTYGIIVFQEQVDQLLQKFCGYSGGEAEDIRDTIHKKRKENLQDLLKEKIFERVLGNGYSFTVAEQILELVCGFKGYGFAQGHALAFAEVSLRSVWCMQNHPAEYFAALLSAQPAGYYGPCTIANEARSRGVQMLLPDVNKSQIEFHVEDARLEGGMAIPGGAIRVGLMQIQGVSEKVRHRIMEHHLAESEVFHRRYQPLKSSSIEAQNSSVALAEKDEHKLPELKPFRSFFDFVAKVRPSRDELETFILCGSLDSLCGNRRAMLWGIPEAYAYAEGVNRLLDTRSLPLELVEPRLDLTLEDFPYKEKIVYERKLLGMDVDTHLMTFERKKVAAKGGLTAREVVKLPPGTLTMAVGNPIRLRFPPTASGKRVVFFDLEDESGMLNVTAFDDVYRRDGKAIVCSAYTTVLGEVQDRDGHAAFLAHRIFEYKSRLFEDRRQQPPMKTADFLVG